MCARWPGASCSRALRCSRPTTGPSARSEADAPRPPRRRPGAGGGAGARRVALGRRAHGGAPARARRAAAALALSLRAALPVTLAAGALKGVRLARRGRPRPPSAAAMAAGAAAALASSLAALPLLPLLEQRSGLRAVAAYRIALARRAACWTGRWRPLADSRDPTCKVRPCRPYAAWPPPARQPGPVSGANPRPARGARARAAAGGRRDVRDRGRGAGPSSARRAGSPTPKLSEALGPARQPALDAPPARLVARPCSSATGRCSCRASEPGRPRPTCWPPRSSRSAPSAHARSGAPTAARR